MDSSPFLSTLSNVVNGVKALEDFATTVVGLAIEDTLLRVARDHGLDFSKLVAAYKDVVLDKHVTVGVGGGVSCIGKTRGGKKCGRRAACMGYCRAHFEQLKVAEHDDHRATAYANVNRMENPTAAALRILRGSPIEPVGHRMISKPHHPG